MQLAQQLRPLRLPAAETEEFGGREPQTALGGEHPGVTLHKIMKTRFRRIISVVKSLYNIVFDILLSTQSCSFNPEKNHLICRKQLDNNNII